jgi:hypothetical protein
MKFRVHNEQNIANNGMIFHHYFRTKKEAIAHAEKIGGNAVIEKKIGSNWFGC